IESDQSRLGVRFGGYWQDSRWCAFSQPRGSEIGGRRLVFPSWRNIDTCKSGAINRALNETGITDRCNKLLDDFQFRAIAFSNHERLIDIQKTIGKCSNLRTRCRLRVERPLPVDCECIDFAIR